MTETKSLGAFLVVGLVMGILFDYFFYGKDLGIALPIFLAIGSLAILISAARLKHKLPLEAYASMGILLLFGLFNALRLNMFLVILNTLVVLFAGAILIATTQGETLRQYSFARYLGLMGSPFVALRSVMRMAGEIGKDSRNERTQKWGPYVRGVLLAIPLLLIFGLLFAWADTVFKDLIQRVFHFTLDGEIIFRNIEALVVGSVIAGALGRMFFEPAKEITTREPKTPTGNTEMVVLLSLLNLLFLAFIIVQLRYLFGDQSTVKSLGITYAEYAREGFGQLIFSGLLTFLVVWATQNSVNYSLPAKSKYFWVAGLLIAQVGIILASAYKRLVLYEGAYGFTLDRFWAHTILFALLGAFALLVWKLKKNQEDSLFLRSLVSLAVVSLVVVNIVNPERFVAHQNITRWQKTGKIDVAYLKYLREDAIPATGPLLESNHAAGTELANQYYNFRQSLTVNPAISSWQSTNLSRQRAIQFLETHQSTLEKNKNRTPTACAVPLPGNTLPSQGILTCIQPATSAN